jgi:hypothetical protein
MKDYSDKPISTMPGPPIVFWNGLCGPCAYMRVVSHSVSHVYSMENPHCYAFNKGLEKLPRPVAPIYDVKRCKQCLDYEETLDNPEPIDAEIGDWGFSP